MVLAERYSMQDKQEAYRRGVPSLSLFHRHHHRHPRRLEEAKLFRW